MATGENLRSELYDITKDLTTSVFNSLMNKSEDPVECEAVMEKFRIECPGLYEFVTDADATEKELILESGTEEDKAKIEQNPNDFAPFSYGMLLGYLTLKEIADTASFRAALEL